MLQNSDVTAEQLKLSPKTLAKWRVYGQGPAFFKVGRKVMYDRGEVQNWLENQRRASTSQVA